MIHRATVQVNTPTGTDSHGHPTKPVWTLAQISPCWVYNSKDAFINDTEKTTVIRGLKIAFDLSANITEAHRVSLVTDKNTVTLYSGNYLVRNKVRKYTHYEANLVVAE
jgi:hypothetical protein